LEGSTAIPALCHDGLPRGNGTNSRYISLASSVKRGWTATATERR
jgi:hypothetical protein